MIVSLMRLAVAVEPHGLAKRGWMKGTQQGNGREEKHRGMEHRSSWTKRVQGLANVVCDWLTCWKDGGKRSACIINDTASVSDLCCHPYWVVVKQVTAQESTKHTFTERCEHAMCQNCEKQQYRRTLYTWSSVCIIRLAQMLQQRMIKDLKLAFRLWLFASQVMRKDSIGHYRWIRCFDDKYSLLKSM